MRRRTFMQRVRFLRDCAVPGMLGWAVATAWCGRPDGLNEADIAVLCCGAWLLWVWLGMEWNLAYHAKACVADMADASDQDIRLLMVKLPSRPGFDLDFHEALLSRLRKVRPGAVPGLEIESHDPDSRSRGGLRGA